MFDAWSAYNAALTTEPLITKSITAGVIIGAGDAAAQQLERRRTGESFDAARYLRCTLPGLEPWLSDSQSLNPMTGVRIPVR